MITRHAILEEGVTVHSGAVVGGDPQYLKFDPATPSSVRVGAGTVLRENVTINRGIHAGGETRIGPGCFLMAGSHVAHDCCLGAQVVLANNALLAGHVEVGDLVFVGGGAAAHQFVRIGESVMIGGLARITRDLAPYTIVAERDEVSGLNLVGLRRRGFSRDTLRELKAAFRAVYYGQGKMAVRAEQAVRERGFATAEAAKFLHFFLTGKRGFARASGAAAEGAEE